MMKPEHAKLVEDNIDLVGRVMYQAAGSFPPHIDKDEIWQSGAFGLLFASTRFDEEQGVPFRRFAAKHIKWSITNFARARDWAPRSVRQASRELEAAWVACTHRLGHTPGEAEVAQALGITVGELSAMRARTHRSTVLSLDAEMGEAHPESGVSLGDRMEDPSAAEEFESMEAAQLHNYLRVAVRNLPPRTAEVIRWYFLDGRTSREIADALQVTESRVSQLRSEGLKLLKLGIEAQYEGEPVVDPTSPVAERRQATYARTVYEETRAMRSGAAAELDTYDELVGAA